jgi:hypothetical protein
MEGVRVAVSVHPVEYGLHGRQPRNEDDFDLRAFQQRPQVLGQGLVFHLDTAGAIATKLAVASDARSWSAAEASDRSLGR